MMQAQNLIVYVLIIVSALSSGCSRHPESISLQVDSTVLPYTERRDGYRFVPDESVTVELCVRQTGHEDRTLRHQFEAGHTVIFGYRLANEPLAHGMSPDLQEVRCDVYLGRVKEAKGGTGEASSRTDYPVNWPPNTKLIRFCVGSGSTRTFRTGHQKRGAVMGEELRLFSLENGQSDESLVLTYKLNTHEE